MAYLLPLQLGVQPANPLLLPGNNLNIVPMPRTFQQFYADASKDPCKGDYPCIMA
jgi:hypothetical protein